jgi:hypothetical protein
MLPTTRRWAFPCRQKIRGACSCKPEHYQKTAHVAFGEGTMDGKGADRILEGLDEDDKAEVMRFIDFVRTRKVKIRGVK